MIDTMYSNLSLDQSRFGLAAVNTEGAGMESRKRGSKPLSSQATEFFSKICEMTLNKNYIFHAPLPT